MNILDYSFKKMGAYVIKIISSVQCLYLEHGQRKLYQYYERKFGYKLFKLHSVVSSLDVCSHSSKKYTHIPSLLLIILD